MKLVECLRIEAGRQWTVNGRMICMKAAAEIERLQDECNELRKHAMEYRNKYERLMEENAR